MPHIIGVYLAADQPPGEPVTRAALQLDNGKALVIELFTDNIDLRLEDSGPDTVDGTPSGLLDPGRWHPVHTGTDLEPR